MGRVPLGPGWLSSIVIAALVVGCADEVPFSSADDGAALTASETAESADPGPIPVPPPNVQILIEGYLGDSDGDGLPDVPCIEEGDQTYCVADKQGVVAVLNQAGATPANELVAFIDGLQDEGGALERLDVKSLAGAEETLVIRYRIRGDRVGYDPSRIGEALRGLGEDLSPLGGTLTGIVALWEWIAYLYPLPPGWLGSYMGYFGYDIVGGHAMHRFGCLFDQNHYNFGWWEFDGFDGSDLCHHEDHWTMRSYLRYLGWRLTDWYGQSEPHLYWNVLEPQLDYYCCEPWHYANQCWGGAATYNLLFSDPCNYPTRHAEGNSDCAFRRLLQGQGWGSVPVMSPCW